MKEELKSQLHVPATLSLGKVLPVPIGVTGSGRERKPGTFLLPPSTICEEIKVEKEGTVININIKN
jgi:hypothetical protein